MFKFKSKPEDAIFSLLEEERQIILGGDLSKLEALLLKKEKLIERLTRSDVDAVKLEAIKQAEQHNAVLYKAAMAGLKAVSAKLKAIVETQSGLGTYGTDGKKQGAGSVTTSLVRRA